MTWFKVDDKFHSHSKVRKILADEPAALALWVVAGSWSADNTTDGVVPDHQLPWLFPTGGDELARKLVNARLWRRVRGGYEFHEWDADADGTRRNPTREEVEEVRRKKAEAGRKGGLASGKTRSKPQARASPNASALAEAGARGVVELPSRPDQELFQSSLGGRGAARTREARRAAPSPPPVRAGPPRARCVEHEWDDDPPRCGACANAQARADARVREGRIDAKIAERRKLADDRQRAIDNCSLCDDNGYAGTSLCGHDPDAQARAARGRAIVNDAMGWSADEQDPP